MGEAGEEGETGEKSGEAILCSGLLYWAWWADLLLWRFSLSVNAALKLKQELSIFFSTAWPRRLPVLLESCSVSTPGAPAQADRPGVRSVFSDLAGPHSSPLPANNESPPSAGGASFFFRVC